MVSEYLQSGGHKKLYDNIVNCSWGAKKSLLTGTAVGVGLAAAPFLYKGGSLASGNLPDPATLSTLQNLQAHSVDIGSGVALFLNSGRGAGPLGVMINSALATVAGAGFGTALMETDYLPDLKKAYAELNGEVNLSGTVLDRFTGNAKLGAALGLLGGATYSFFDSKGHFDRIKKSALWGVAAGLATKTLVPVAGVMTKIFAPESTHEGIDDVVKGIGEATVPFGTATAYLSHTFTEGKFNFFDYFANVSYGVITGAFTGNFLAERPNYGLLNDIVVGLNNGAKEVLGEGNITNAVKGDGTGLGILGGLAGIAGNLYNRAKYKLQE